MLMEKLFYFIFLDIGILLTLAILFCFPTVVNEWVKLLTPLYTRIYDFFHKPEVEQPIEECVTPRYDIDDFSKRMEDIRNELGHEFDDYVEFIQSDKPLHNNYESGTEVMTEDYEYELDRRTR